MENSDKVRDYMRTSIHLNSTSYQFLKKYPGVARSKIINQIIFRYESLLKETFQVRFDEIELKIIKNILPKRYEPDSLYLFLKNKKKFPSNLLAKIRNLTKSQEICLLDRIDKIGLGKGQHASE